MNSSKIKVKKLIKANDLALDNSEKSKLDDPSISKTLSTVAKNISSFKGIIAKPEKPVSIEDMKATIKFDNIFDAVTDNKEAAKQLAISADLIIALRDVVEEKGWNSEEAINLVSAKIKEAIEDTIQTRHSLSQTLDKISTK